MTLSKLDAAELERFATYIRLLHEAQLAGCTLEEAQESIYADLYGDDSIDLDLQGRP